MNLRDIKFEPSYSSYRGSLLKDFYIPVLSCAKEYNRITGYFSPKVFAVAARGFKECIKNDCKIRIVTSVELDQETYNALEMMNDRSFLDKTIESFEPESIDNDLDYSYLQLFMYLYASGKLELKIAATVVDNAIFHPKIGIVTDSEGDSISFSGSNNETAKGWLFNVENFKVFTEWDDYKYFQKDQEDWEAYWNDNCIKMKIVSLDEARKDIIIDKTNKEELSFDEIVKTIDELEEEEISGSDNGDWTGEYPEPKPVRKYQNDAIEHWKRNNYDSIFAMATGTGKTYTSILALDSFRKENGGLHVVVVVPLLSLISQWSSELKSYFSDIIIIEATTQVDNKWRAKFEEIILAGRMGIHKDFIIITTYDAFITDEFNRKISNLVEEDIILVADEMHNLVTENCINSAKNIKYKYHLGLSATPTRLWRQDESKIVRGIFGNNQFTFDLERAIREGFLVEFFYHPIVVHLSMDEYTDYIDLTRKIGQYSYDNDEEGLNDIAKQYMLKRAKIKKNAMNKFLKLKELVSRLDEEGLFYSALVYTDNHEALGEVQRLLAEKNILTRNFTAESSLSQREQTIDILRKKIIKAIVAIKCLDEGVDIPSAQLAFLVSSNTDQREYVQRLGRVLRLDPEGKKSHSDVYDFIVVPPEGMTYYTDEGEKNTARKMVKNEMIRASFFAGLAKNKDDIEMQLFKIMNDYGFIFTEDELKLDIKEDASNANAQ